MYRDEIFSFNVFLCIFFMCYVHFIKICYGHWCQGFIFNLERRFADGTQSKRCKWAAIVPWQNAAVVSFSVPSRRASRKRVTWLPLGVSSKREEVRQWCYRDPSITKALDPGSVYGRPSLPGVSACRSKAALDNKVICFFFNAKKKIN